MKVATFAALGLMIVPLGWTLSSPARAQTQPAGCYSPTIPGAAPPSYQGPQGWQYNPCGGSNYAPNGSTGYAPYSQDQMNDVIHDGSNGGGGGGRR